MDMSGEATAERKQGFFPLGAAGREGREGRGLAIRIYARAPFVNGDDRWS